MNDVCLIGTIDNNYQICFDKNENQKLLKFILKVKKPFKNKEGQFAYDYIKINVWSNIIGDINSDLQIGEIIAIKGRVQSYCYTKKEQQVIYFNEIFAEQILNVATEFV